jgi:hypothetical protein
MLTVGAIFTAVSVDHDPDVALMNHPDRPN